MTVQLPSGRVVSLHRVPDAEPTAAREGRSDAQGRRVQGRHDAEGVRVQGRHGAEGVRVQERHGAEGVRVQERHGALTRARALFAAGDVEVREGSAVIDAGGMALGDFHALRAIATRLGWLSEEPVTFPCRNCHAEITHAPCAALPLGPFKERALDDPELDARFDFDAVHAAGAHEIRLAPITLDDAAPLHAAIARGAPLGPRDRRRRGARHEPAGGVGPRFIAAMGIRSFDGETSKAAIARTLRRVDQSTWERVTNLFLAAHYTLRLFSMAQCAECGARNDVDAPYDREFEPSDGGAGAIGSDADSFPTFDAFADRARSLAAEILPRGSLEGASSELTFVVEGGVAACDDGGEPLLGSYVPPFAGDALAPVRSGEITVFYRTFRAIWDEEGPYDWDGELSETIEHELEHHAAHVGPFGGDDPMDEEERREIDREASRIHGERTLVAAQAGALAKDLGEFMRRTWPIWALVVLGTAIANLADCGG